MRRPAVAAAVGSAALGLAATVMIVTLHTLQRETGSELLQANARAGGGTWQMLRPWLEPPENLEDLEVSWGRFDCFRYGPLWESRAIGCDRPGGCDAPIEPPTFKSHLDECGDSSEVCVDLFKTCLLRNHPETRPPTPADCNCYFDAMELGCTPECSDKIFRKYGELSQRCYGFNVYTGCRYVDAHRLPEHQHFGMLREEAGAPLLLLADPADPDPELQFRQPAGTYTQSDMSGTLIEPWQYDSRAFDPREDPPFDDDDPRE
mmetsp:Transcript_56600/g.133279  ORF Transcript_56600/g.133279 Transcript_56600/m.133279 type:complete len:262 (+) Transcript_56600:3-788(+)